MIHYDDINSYHIRENFYLFFDIFLKNNELILICPTYVSNFDENTRSLSVAVFTSIPGFDILMPWSVIVLGQQE